MIKYHLISPVVGPHIALYCTEYSCKKSLTHADNLLFPPTHKEVEKRWKFFERNGWSIQKVSVTLEKIE